MSVPRLAIVLPRSRRFGPAGATAIDLCVRDFTAFSRHRERTMIFAEPIEEPFPGFDFRPVARPQGEAQWFYSNRLAREVAAARPDLVVVHQHMPTAVRLSKQIAGVPVLLHRHTNHKRRRNAIARWRDSSSYKRLARLIWVSDFCRTKFIGDYPEFAARSVTVHNGLDFADWRPILDRRNEVLFAGRLTAEKGCLEAAQATCAALLDAPAWRAKFMLARRQSEPGYLEAVTAALAPLGARAEIVFDADHDSVKAAYCNAAVALVPSLYEEPFGRTAIEAFAGGAALVTTMRGGLREICEGFAEPAAPNAAALTEALRRLLADATYRVDMARRARAHGEAAFDIRAKAAQLDDLYEHVLSERVGVR